MQRKTDVTPATKSRD